MSAEDLGGADLHCKRSGVTDHYAERCRHEAALDVSFLPFSSSVFVLVACLSAPCSLVDVAYYMRCRLSSRSPLACSLPACLRTWLLRPPFSHLLWCRWRLQRRARAGDCAPHRVQPQLEEAAKGSGPLLCSYWLGCVVSLVGSASRSRNPDPILTVVSAGCCVAVTSR